MAGAPAEKIYKKTGLLSSFPDRIRFWDFIPKITGEFPLRNHPVPKGVCAVRAGDRMPFGNCR
jgi:hypothetical protein